MSKIAGTLSPVAESVKSKTINEILTEEERSVEELLQEAEKLVQQNGSNLLKGVLNTDITVPDENNTADKGLTKVKQLEVDIFKMIEEQANQDSSTNSEKRRSLSPSIEVLFENITSQKTLEAQKKKFEEQKVEVSSSSDLDDPIERHSVSEDINDEKKANDKKESLKKEITDVDKDFFDVLIKKTKESAENLSSRSSSFDQEDFTQFLKLLQEQSDKEGGTLSKASSLNLIVDQFDPLKEKSANNDKRVFLERELISVESKKIVYELESPVCQPASIGASKMEKLLEESSRKESSRHSSRDSSKRSSASAKSSAVDTKRVVNNNNELYTVGLTPRLELFADAIPKLLAEKSNETSARKDDEEKAENENDTAQKADDNEDFSFKNFKALDAFKHMEVLNDHKNVTDVQDFKDLVDSQGLDYQRELRDFNYMQESAIYAGFKRSNDHPKTERVISAPENRNTKNETYIGKSRSYDQLSKPSSKLGSSLESVKNAKPIENKKQTPAVIPKKPPAQKTKIQSRTVTKLNPKTKQPMRTRREPTKALHNEFNLDVRGNQIRYDDGVRNSFGGGDWAGAPGEETLEMLYQAERQRFLHLKMDMEAEIETYKAKLKDVQMLHEQEMFSLKKQNILLKAKVDELAQLNKKSADARSKYDPKIMSMQKELERQENMISTYESENKKLMQEVKQLQSELKSTNQQKQKVIVGDNANNNNQDILEKLKDLQEENVKLTIELSDLRQKNNDFSLKNEDVTQQNSLLQEELEMIKDQLRAKNDFINDRLQAMTTNELDLRRQVEDLKVELHSKTEQLKFVRGDYEKFQQSVSPIEKELLDLRTKCTYYQEKLQTAKHNCEREKQLTQKLKDQVILDNKNIMDLNRQVREMERILKRKNPDSVSALILTANSENEKLNLEKVKLLEDRISFLESEIKAKEDMAQAKLSDIQKKFTDMKDKYSSQVADLEHKLKTSPRERKIYGDASTQTMHRSLESRGSEPNLAEKGMLNINKAGPKSQNLKEDTHLIATIRGLKMELVNKDKTVSKLTKEFQEIQKTNRKLQKEREKLLNERRNMEKFNNKVMTSSDSKLSSLKANEGNDPNSNFYQNGLSNGKKLSTSQHKLNDPSQIMTENSETNNRLKKLTNENDVLKEELSRINKDFVALKNKRLQDLNLLQEEHEKEIALIVKEYSVKVGDTKALKLQGQVNSQMAMISHLKQQIEKLQDFKEQVIILKAERDHLESKNRILNEKVKYLSTPSSQQLQLLQDKITILQQRHETRELSLQKLVRDLLRSRTQGCKDCKGGGGGSDRNKQHLCYFRQELDNILGTLQDLTSP
ncbi:hypothetical protein TSAR_011831 [Trichomalopsis sarcophagae]|uniref:Centrosomal protein of 162 kDa n=1 Tax=Trichomalopsis sarcophagae TaxID=543379 RepID=A0A232F518_9HYME|nr:hypothetical protein TSAR_011831 [Trichomalopsis sarcophagae]